MSISENTKYHLRYGDIDRDASQAGIHPFNSIGKAYGIYIVESKTREITETVYAPSEESAYHNARLKIMQAGGIIGDAQ